MMIRNGAAIPNGVKISTLENGDVFAWRGDLYIKAANSDYNAVQLDNGNVYFLDDGDKVEPVKGEFVLT